MEDNSKKFAILPLFVWSAAAKGVEENDLLFFGAGEGWRVCLLWLCVEAMFFFFFSSGPFLSPSRAPS